MADVAQKNVLILLFKGVNTLDVNGPLEVLCNYTLRKQKETCEGTDLNWNPYRIFIAAEEKTPVTAYEFIQLCPNTTYNEALDMIAKREVDILITPGFAGNPDVLDAMIKRNDPTFNVVKKFFEMDSTDKERWMISICVGALIHAYVGVFEDRKATTHWGALKDLASYSHNKAIVVSKRWEDAGVTPNGLRILSSGGISCGLDAMLYFISQDQKSEDPDSGIKVAQKLAYGMDYAWNGGPKQPTDEPITTQ